jgi:N6-adenosine-specific RNA methylase IME4
MIGRRGSLGFKSTRGALTTVGTWKQPYASGKIHSAKPDGFLDHVEALCDGPYLELFARRQRLGWDTWGNEALEHVAL